MGCGSSAPDKVGGAQTPGHHSSFIGDLSGHYFSFKSGGNPTQVVDRFEARQDGNVLVYFRNGPVGSTGRVESATANPMESYTLHGNKLYGPVEATIQANGDIVYSHGYTSRKEADSKGSTAGKKYWVVYKNIDMCFQGDKEIIHDWRATWSIDALREMVAEKGTPVESVGASGKPLESMTLMEMAEELKRQLGLKDMGSVNDTVKAAAGEVGVAVEGKPLIALAKECLTAVGYGV